MKPLKAIQIEIGLQALSHSINEGISIEQAFTTIANDYYRIGYEKGYKEGLKKKGKKKDEKSNS